jgi:hypothetical protein
MTTKPLSDLARLTGVVTTAELLGAGLTQWRIAALVRTGELVALQRGVYVDAAAAERIGQISRGPFVTRALAALATTQPGAVISHHTAAQLHSLDLLTAPDEISITRAAGAGSRSGKAGVHVHAARLPAGHARPGYTAPSSGTAPVMASAGVARRGTNG